MNETPRSVLSEVVTTGAVNLTEGKTGRTRFWLPKLWDRLQAASPFGSNVVLTAGANGILAFVALVTGPICARLLGPAGRGELAAIQNLYWFAATIGMLGLPEATLYFTAQRKYDAKRILVSAVLIVLLAWPILYLAVVKLIPVLLAAQSPSVIAMAKWYLAAVPLYAFVVIPVYSLRGNNDLVRWNMMRILPGIGWLLMLLIVSIFSRPSPELVAAGYLTMLALLLLPTALVTFRRIRGRFLPQPIAALPLLKFGLPLAASTVPTVLNLRMDQMLMAAVLPSKSLGLYVAAAAWSAAVTQAFVAVAWVLFPRVAAAPPDQRAAVLGRGLRLGMAVGLPVTMVVAVLAPVGVPLLFGKPFQEAVYPAVVLVFAAGIAGVNVVLEEGLLGLGRSIDVFWGETFGLAATILGLALLLKPFGIFGAAMVSLVAYSATTAMLAYRVKLATNVSVKTLFIPRVSELKEAWSRIGTFRSRRSF